MILVDTSAWVEFLRSTGSAVDAELDRLLPSGLAVTEPVVMEVLAGARDDRHLSQLRSLLARADLLPVRGTDHAAAASMHRACRLNGETVRKLIDCLSAAVAVREGVPVLHADRDYDVLGRWTPLRVHDV